jgi:hypothetical protein
MISQTDFDKLEELRTNTMNELAQLTFTNVSAVELQIAFDDFYNKILHKINDPVPPATNP